LDEVIDALAPRDNAVYADGTFGGGGYSQALLAAAQCPVWAIDRDPRAIARGQSLIEQYGGRLHIVEGQFGEVDRLLGTYGVKELDGGLVLDVGFSSDQMDDPARGFSFRDDGPLDMRMSASGPTAADVVNEASEQELADIIYNYGEERRARRVAAAIVAARAERPLTRTGDLAGVIRAVLPRRRDGIDPATLSFQALRIHVNDELGELERALAAAERLLTAGARLVVVSFESLNDRIVKRFMAARAKPAPRPSRHSPAADQDVGALSKPSFRLVHRRPVRPSAEEIAANPRARSARLRAAERTDAPPMLEAA
jgi:16S rRNA (cytosine1402-N4)-methyltransferase